MRALISGRPGTRRRTRISAATTPKIAFSGTAMAVMMSVSWRACRASGVVTASHAAPIPSSNAFQKTSASGATRMTAR